ncbi:hypothetical protein JMJ77_0013979 [Colletotrichum scovillei]|uniref:Uncharacterized protein n=1 Tax=Colletotrichum scovillei TaxID=1209932 RepID=A0A9P7R2H8_9PEZI|nr:hypothetical protein JMJ77_0013979 [Colletotrichum scovillei]KAG7065502.1 hypothetical protein JMJ78_0012255 [Colletotrichum scovillei]KAG7068102.1 hypothetical protein JMJ76_0007798 [Colletotrichum scovillei]
MNSRFHFMERALESKISV